MKSKNPDIFIALRFKLLFVKNIDWLIEFYAGPYQNACLIKMYCICMYLQLSNSISKMHPCSLFGHCPSP